MESKGSGEMVVPMFIGFGFNLTDLLGESLKGLLEVGIDILEFCICAIRLTADLDNWTLSLRFNATEASRGRESRLKAKGMLGTDLVVSGGRPGRLVVVAGRT
jgi:hypothetical protein